jgi:hypothetical protein
MTYIIHTAELAILIDWLTSDGQDLIVNESRILMEVVTKVVHYQSCAASE